jgi:hypothetical protein
VKLVGVKRNARQRIIMVHRPDCPYLDRALHTEPITSNEADLRYPACTRCLLEHRVANGPTYGLLDMSL